MKELNNKSQEELEKILMELKEKLRSLRFELSASQIEDAREVRKTRKDIARVLTILNSKEQKNDTAGDVA